MIVSDSIGISSINPTTGSIPCWKVRTDYFALAYIYNSTSQSKEGTNANEDFN